MKVIHQLVQYLQYEGRLGHADLTALVRLGFAQEEEYGWDEERDYGYPCGENTDLEWTLEDEQEALAEASAPSTKEGGKVGQARKTWWKGYQVTQLASRRRR